MNYKINLIKSKYILFSYGNRILQYFFTILLGIRIFPGQDPTHVYVGWVTTQYHLHSKDFNQTQVLKSSVVIVDDYDRVADW